MGVGGGLERPEAPSNNRCNRLVRGIQAAELKFSVFYRANKVSPTDKNREELRQSHHKAGQAYPKSGKGCLSHLILRVLWPLVFEVQYIVQDNDQIDSQDVKCRIMLDARFCQGQRYEHRRK